MGQKKQTNKTNNDTFNRGKSAIWNVNVINVYVACHFVMVIHFSQCTYNSLEQQKEKHWRELFSLVVFQTWKRPPLQQKKIVFHNSHNSYDFSPYISILNGIVNEKEMLGDAGGDEEIRMFLKRSVTAALIVCNSSIYIIFDSFCRQSHMLIWEFASFPFQSTYLSILTHNYAFNAEMRKKKKKTMTTTKKKWLKWKDVKQRNVENQQQHQCWWRWRCCCGGGSHRSELQKQHRLRTNVFDEIKRKCNEKDAKTRRRNGKAEGLREMYVCVCVLYLHQAETNIWR